MKKVVGGVLYDTDRAVQCVSWRETVVNFGVRTDYSFTLYRKVVPKPGVDPATVVKVSKYGSVSVDRDLADERSGEFFLAVEGPGWNDDAKRVEPVSVDCAKSTVEARGDCATWERFFGTPAGVSETDAIARAVEERVGEIQRQKWDAERERDALKAKLEELSK